jgi:hypothetical protein
MKTDTGAAPEADSRDASSKEDEASLKSQQIYSLTIDALARHCDGVHVQYCSLLELML